MNCALCLKDTKLCESHIYPEFLYDKVYDENHSFFVMSSASDSFPKRQRKGVYEELLCKNCEEHINNFEDYAAKVLFGGVRKTIQQLPNKLLVSGLQYDKFKLFQMSILWRTGASKRSEFRNIKLGPHQEILRQMLLNDNPGEPYEYGCLMTFIPGVKDLMERMVFPLESLNRKIRGYRMYRGIFGGLFWAFIVSSHNDKFPFKEVFIEKQGVLSIYKAPPSAEEFVFDVAKSMAETIKKIR